MNTENLSTITLNASEVNIGNIFRDPMDGSDIVVINYFASEDEGLVYLGGVTVVDNRVVVVSRQYRLDQSIRLLY